MDTKNINFIEKFLENDYSDLKKSLEKLLKDYKRKEKENMILQQSKLAAMGEMMDAVAHQWKQPINIIQMQIDMLEYDFDDKIVDKKYVKELKENMFRNIKHMTNTLDEFRTFFRPNKNIEEFYVKEMIKKVLLLVKDEFMKNSITINLNVKDNYTLIGVENEFKHLVLNIINNSKDAFIENNIENRQIDIEVFSDESSCFLAMSDNAGGIPNDVINNIFKANFTTKGSGKGTGIGLYMSEQIAVKHNGKLTVQNIENGAKFIFQYIKEN